MRTPKLPNELMETFENAPLIYTHGVMQFPKLPSEVIESVADAFHARMREKYPIPDHGESPTITADFNAEGLKFSQQATRLWQFAAPDKRWAFILTDETLALHTNTHEQHRAFVDRFVDGARALASIERAAIKWIGSIGVRYVNLVIPEKGERLQDYLLPWAFPADQPVLYTKETLPVEKSMYVISCRSKFGDLRYQALRNPPSTIPPELVTSLVNRNRWSRPVPEGDFAVVDLEHSRRFEPLQPFELDELDDCLDGLCGFVSNWFSGGATDRAIGKWRGKRA